MKHQQQSDDKFIDEVEDTIYNSAKFLSENEVPKGYIKKHKNKLSSSIKVKRFIVRYIPVTIMHLGAAIAALIFSQMIATDKETGLINSLVMFACSFLFLIFGQCVSSLITFAYLSLISKWESQK